MLKEVLISFLNSIEYHTDLEEVEDSNKIISIDVSRSEYEKYFIPAIAADGRYVNNSTKFTGGFKIKYRQNVNHTIYDFDIVVIRSKDLYKLTIEALGRPRYNGIGFSYEE